MPNVPRYEGPQVQTAPLPQVRFQAADVGAEKIGQGLQAVGGVLGQMAQQERAKADAARLMEADSALWAAERDVFHDPDKGYFNTQGKDAIERGPAALGEWERQASGIEATLSSAEQKMRFRQLRQQRQQSLQLAQMRHQTKAGEQYYGQQLQATQTGAVEEYARAVGDAENQARVMGNTIGAIQAYYGARGAPDNVIAGEVLKQQTAMHSAVIRSMLTENPAGAQEYFDAHEGQMTEAGKAALREPIEKRVKYIEGYETGVRAVDGGASPDAVADVMNKAWKAATASGADDAAATAAAEAARSAGVGGWAPAATEAEALARVRSEYPDPTDSRRHDAEQTVRNLFNERENTKRASDQAVSERSTATIYSLPVADLTKPLPQIVGAEAMRHAELNGYVGRLEAMVAQRIAGTMPKTNPLEYDRMLRLSTADPVAFGKLNLPLMQGQYETGDYEVLLRRWQDLKKPDAEKKVQDWASESDRLEVAYASLGYASRDDKGATKDERAMARYRIDLSYRQALAQWQQSNPGKSPDPTTLDNLRDIVVREARLNPSNLRNAESLEMYRSTITGAQRREAMADFAAAGKPNPTDADIIRWVARKYPQKKDE